MVSFNYRKAGHSHLRGVDFAFDGYCEFKKVLAMPSGRLQKFDGATIEVELEVQGTLRSIKGTGSYQANDPDLGPVLRILVNDPLGDIEFLIAESDWEGRFETSDLPGCDCRVSFATRPQNSGRS